jgi:hypothetical protein
MAGSDGWLNFDSAQTAAIRLHFTNKSDVPDVPAPQPVAQSPYTTQIKAFMRPPMRRSRSAPPTAWLPYKLPWRPSVWPKAAGVQFFPGRCSHAENGIVSFAHLHAEAYIQPAGIPGVEMIGLADEDEARCRHFAGLFNPGSICCYDAPLAEHDGSSNLLKK